MKKKIVIIGTLVIVMIGLIGAYLLFVQNKVLDPKANTAQAQTITNRSDKTLYTKIKQTGYYDEVVRYQNGEEMRVLGRYFKAGDTYDLDSGEATLKPSEFLPLTGKSIKIDTSGFYYCDLQLQAGTYRVSVADQATIKGKDGKLLDASAYCEVADLPDMQKIARQKGGKSQQYTINPQDPVKVTIKKGQVFRVKMTASYVLLEKE